jgi:glucosamine--fructose-6-phosphate aminotransferase (isomerizing)
MCLASSDSWSSAARSRPCGHHRNRRDNTAKIIAIVTEGDTAVKAMADHCIEIPETDEILMPLLATIPLQLLSYHIATMRGCNVDQPRNLAKSVTVE